MIERCLQQKLEMNFASSLLELTKMIPKEKIYLLQISHAYKLSVPMKADVENENGEVFWQGENGLRARGRWSHDYRPYPFNGGWLPVVQVAKAVLGTGFRGCFLMEVFDSGADAMAGPGPGQRWGTGEDEMKAFVTMLWRVIRGCWRSVLLRLYKGIWLNMKEGEVCYVGWSLEVNLKTGHQVRDILLEKTLDFLNAQDLKLIAHSAMCTIDALIRCCPSHLRVSTSVRSTKH